MNARSQATAKYQEKVGLISKSYKLPKDVVEKFKAACEAEGISQSAALTEFMSNYPKVKTKIVRVESKKESLWSRMTRR